MREVRAVLEPACQRGLNSAVFPGLQGGQLMHVIAAKAVAFKEALAPEFKTYEQQVVKNAVALAETLVQRGLRIFSGRTESHVMLVLLNSGRHVQCLVRGRAIRWVLEHRVSINGLRTVQRAAHGGAAVARRGALRAVCIAHGRATTDIPMPRVPQPAR